jgi:Domain of unknown function (DUF4352)
MQQRISSDGAHYWDGTAWRPLSPDRRSYWNGTEWWPVAPASRGRRWPWLAGGAAALVVLLGLCTIALASGGSRAARARPPASAASTCAQPCAEADGWAVQAANLRYDASSGSPFRKPEAGNVFVAVDVTFLNHTAAEKHVNPFDFVLRDGAGVKHPVTWLDTCPLWTAVNLTAGATYGPKCLAFEAAAGRPAGLTLVWTPRALAGDHDIALS